MMTRSDRRSEIERQAYEILRRDGAAITEFKMMEQLRRRFGSRPHPVHLKHAMWDLVSIERAAESHPPSMFFGTSFCSVRTRT